MSKKKNKIIHSHKGTFNIRGNVNIHESGVADIHYEEVYAQKGVDENGEEHIDYSATSQPWRKKETPREKGAQISPKYMTAREFRKFNAGVWDGVERFDNTFNFTPHDWACENNPNLDIDLSLDKRVSNRRKIRKSEGGNRKYSRRGVDQAIKREHAYNQKLYKIFILTGVIFYFLWAAFISYGGGALVE